MVSSQRRDAKAQRTPTCLLVLSIVSSFAFLCVLAPLRLPLPEHLTGWLGGRMASFPLAQQETARRRAERGTFSLLWTTGWQYGGPVVSPRGSTKASSEVPWGRSNAEAQRRREKRKRTPSLGTLKWLVFSAPLSVGLTEGRRLGGGRCPPEGGRLPSVRGLPVRTRTA